MPNPIACVFLQLSAKLCSAPAEELYEIDDVTDEPGAAELDFDDSAISRASDSKVLTTRWLGHTTKQDLFEQYEHWHLCHGSGKPGGKTTFRRVWMARWRGIIKIRRLLCR